MGDRLIQYVVMGLLVVVLGVPFLMRPSGPKASGKVDDQLRLVVATPHSEQIRYEFANGFNRWRVAQGKTPITFDWRSSGGSSDLRKALMSQFEKLALTPKSDGTGGLEDDGIGVDLVFGGGDIEFNTMATGVEVKRGDKLIKIPILIPMDLPAAVMAEAFPEQTIAGTPLNHKEQRWIGVVLSSFGVIYNRDLTAMLKLPEPKTWADLADPGYLHSVALADPSQSGSIRAAYNCILRRYGWDKGWHILRRVYGNSRYFTSSAAKVPVDVSAGECAAGMCIDFYGRYQGASVGGGRVGYVDPARLTAIGPDPIALVRGSKRQELAREFVIWVLSKDGQGLWQRRVGTPGGPEKYELGRMPIRRDMYVKEEVDKWTDRVDPFGAAEAFAPDTPDYFRCVAMITQSMAIDVHEEITAAWGAIVVAQKKSDGSKESVEKIRKMNELFDAMPAELVIAWPNDELRDNWSAILANPKDPHRGQVVKILKDFNASLGAPYKDPITGKDRMVEDRLRWALFFRENYRKIVEMGR